VNLNRVKAVKGPKAASWLIDSTGTSSPALSAFEHTLLCANSNFFSLLIASEEHRFLSELMATDLGIEPTFF
jgi:hypothetical protein